jgi:S-adenosylmethionine:tRNA ribosyltransferase-isomerase
MKITDFEYSLPKNLIAEKPLSNRDSSRLLILHRDGTIEHRLFSDLPLYLEQGDLLILNETKVFPARLYGTKKNKGRLEILLVKQRDDGYWDILSKGKYSGELTISENLTAEIYNGNVARFIYSGDMNELIWKHGMMPLPSYIKRLPDETDKAAYQSVFARHEGSIAAPTASLHFTEKLLHKLVQKGTRIAKLTLHVGIGTFKPIRATDLTEHQMEKEFFEINNEAFQKIEDAKDAGKRVVAVGTTVARALEGYAIGSYTMSPDNGTVKGWTEIFIHPGHRFEVIDSLITNFHLPRSTPLMLTAALCGKENIMKAYKEAIALGYRFLSYGDAMLIL